MSAGGGAPAATSRLFGRRRCDQLLALDHNKQIERAPIPLADAVLAVFGLDGFNTPVTPLGLAGFLAGLFPSYPGSGPSLSSVRPRLLLQGCYYTACRPPHSLPQPISTRYPRCFRPILAQHEI